MENSVNWIEDDIRTVSGLEALFDEPAFIDEPDRGFDANAHYNRTIRQVELPSHHHVQLLAAAIQRGKAAAEKLRVPSDDVELEEDEYWHLKTLAAEGKIAKWELVGSHLRLGAHVARLTMGWVPYGSEPVKANGESVFKGARIKNLAQFAGAPMPYEDRVQLATEGLFAAADNYLPGRARFSTYAMWWIEQAIDRGIRYDRNIKVPIHVQERMSKYDKEAERRFISLGRLPIKQELAESLGMTMFHIDEMLDAKKRMETVPLDEAEADDLIDDNAEIDLDKMDAKIFAERNLSKLQPRIREVVVRRIGLNGYNPQTLEEIAHAMGVTRERVRQIENEGLNSLMAFSWR